MSDPGDGVDEAVGDPVCWLHELCPECGAMPTGDERPADGAPPLCWRCGAPRPVAPEGRP